MKVAQVGLCVMFGGGGHARVLIDSLRLMHAPLSLIILAPDCSLWNGNVMGVPVAGNDSLLPELVQRGATRFLVGIGSTGNNEARRRLFHLGLVHKLEPLAVIHPSAIVSRWAVLGAGVQLLPRCVVNAGARLGANVIVNTGAVVEHDCMVGDHAHLATGAVLAGSVRVGASAHIGCGATVKEGMVVGERAVVGAGAVVVANVSADHIVAGVPARQLKRDNEVGWLGEGKD
jgi:sugar O-acyltransferase (sialic acid O-acetyltransferase NeuD family)